MSITPEMMYWITRCDDIHSFGMILSLATPFVGMLVFGMAFDCKFRPLVNWLVGSVIAVLIILGVLLSVFVPTTKEMAAIYVVPKIANSQTVKDLGEGVVTLAREWLEELRPVKKGGAK